MSRRRSVGRRGQRIDAGRWKESAAEHHAG